MNAWRRKVAPVYAGLDRWRRIGAVSAVIAIALVALLPVDSPLWVVVTRGTEIVAIAVFFIAALGMPPVARSVWWPLWLYAALTVIGDVAYDVSQYHFELTPFPSWADVLYIAAYVPLIGALIVLLRQRQRVWDRQAWIYSAVILLAAISVAVTFVLLPMTSQAQSDLSSYLAMAYPVLDLLVLAILIRLSVGGGRPMRALLLLVASVSLTLLADLVYNALVINDVVAEEPGWLEALFTAGLLLMVGAALDPDARHIESPPPITSAIMSRPRTIALGVGALTAPMLLVLMARNASSPEFLFLALASIAINVLVIWRILLLMSTVQKQADSLAVLSRTDVLTGLPNRRSWDFELMRAVEAARTSDQALTVAMADLDHFKEYNDRHGHLAGDALLAECARAWRACLDPSIFLARYGGQEFALILQGEWTVRAGEALDDMRRVTPMPVTLSVGYARRDFIEPITSTVARADAALYAAKSTGRDRVVDAAGVTFHR